MSTSKGLIRPASLSAAVIVATAMLGLTATIAGATSPGVNGRIAFMRGDTGHWQVWVANPDLSHASQITNEDADSAIPVWSPDATRIAFDSSRSDLPDDDVFTNDVYLMDPDGSDVTKVTDSMGFNGEPAWSPDGAWLAFSSDRGIYPPRQAIYLIHPDGTGLRRVTTLPPLTDWLGSPRFSPDGRKLVFTHFRGGNVLKNRRAGAVAGETSALFTINADGSGQRQITPWGNRPGDADWSPDGKRVVFETVFEHLGNMASVYVVDADGKHLTNLTHDHGITGIGKFDALRFEASFDPVWSPDGTKIMYSRDFLTPDGEFTTGLQTMDVDGSDQQYVASFRGAEHQADWGTAPLQ